MHRTAFWVAIAVTAMLQQGAQAQCVSSNVFAWTPLSTNNGTPSAPSNDTSFPTSPNTSISYLAQGTRLMAVRNINDAGGLAGTMKWQWPIAGPLGSTINNFPSPVPLSNGGFFIFLGATDGFLYKINSGDAMSGNLSVNTKRTAINGGVFPCTSGSDQIIATPTVVLNAFASTRFKNDMIANGHTGDDLVIVVTNTSGCVAGGTGDVTNNRIIAYYASNLAQKWVLNGDGARKVGFGSDGCAVDYANDRLFCGTFLPTSSTGMNSVWAIDTVSSTLTDANGQRAATVLWSDNVGPLQNRPVLGNGKLYVASTNGAIRALGPNGSGGASAPLWTAPPTMPGMITRNIWVETRAGPFQNNIIAVDSAGNLSAYHDNGANASLLWTTVADTPGIHFTSMATVWSNQNRAYVGRSDGRIQQLDLAGGLAQGSLVVNAGATVGDPSLDSDTGPQGAALTVAAMGAPGKIGRACITLSNTSGTGSGGGHFCTTAGLEAADCQDLHAAAYGKQCFHVVCTVGHTCTWNATTLADGTACGDGKDCTCNSSRWNGSSCNANNVVLMGTGGSTTTENENDACSGGACVFNNYTSCPCVNDGDLACGSGNPTVATNSCCGAHNGNPAGCANLLTDPKNCGICGTECPNGSTCNSGICSGSSAVYTTAATLNTQALTNPDGIAYSTTDAFVSTYQGGVGPKSQVLDITHLGGKTTWLANAGFGTAPFHGVGVTPNGSAGSVVTTSVNDDTLAPVPQLGFLSGGAIVQPGSPGAATTATVPFGDHKLDDGPVGPVLDPTLYPGTTRFYIANYGTTGDIQSFTAPGFAASGPLTIPGGAIIDRITGIAMGKNPYTGGTTHAMFIVHGVTLTVWDLGASTRADVNVNSAFRARHGEGAISQLLSVATHPAYGDILIELLDSKGHVIVVNIDPYDRSCRNEFDVSSDEHFSSTFPDGYNTLLPGVTHIAVTPGFTLISLFPQIGGSSTFTEYQVSHF